MGESKMVRIESVVWCDKHGTIHEDSLDPYEYGVADPLCDSEEDENLCRKSHHLAVYRRLRVGERVEGDQV